MTYRFNRFLLFFGILAGLASCRTLKEPEYRGIENFTLQKFDASESKIYLEMKYFNPNKANLKLRKASGKAYLNDSYLGQFHVDTLIRLLRKQDFKVPVTLVVDMKNVVNNSMAALLQSTVTLRFEGSVRLGKGLFYFNYPIHHSGEFNFREMLR